ncbi:hypothetical protein [Bacteroides cellulosilyticus]|jgi:hypothetical protein|uniref:Uncharacterized protein n=2 Tax=Bacteroides cellulosilyticus TaxID=246787 RepID=A0A120A5A4_9BACE|nr:hypothetical protein [Bacteroides cellulosilyticus]KAA5419873.1 hypothetical protein F2Y81_08920 [Bacteroides cellulosilyticus]KWR59621.1 hypothetical protein AA416_00648 [Bacteroides cellulosilyticus]MBX9083689.1 hypothetical protein [Bacteroides cellulosilyticus]MCB6594960.1 hypothetical protein [Bacteroides cellulosilyticus]QUT89639.1 hypothetical protein INE78_01614 [Bacteroides cellulosilyticus]
MKRILFILLATLSTAVCSAGTNAMSNSKVRKETRFLTDKMAYELNLNTEQYNDVYEINYDFISGVRYVMDDVLYGNEWALNRYYDYLDVRNDDLRWVLSSRQYARFMQAEYFYRPIYTSGNRWYFRVYITYTNHNHFYFPRPYHYRTYVGGHYRTHHNNVSYYRGRYKHPYYNGSYRIRDTKSYTTHRRSDFGSVTVRPGSDRAPSRDDVYTTRRSSSSSNRTTTPSTTRRESTNSGATTNTSSSSRNNNSSSRRTNSSTRTNSSSETKSNTSSSRRSSSTTPSTGRKESSSSSVRSSSGSSTRSSGSSSTRSSSSGSSSRSSGDRR